MSGEKNIIIWYYSMVWFYLTFSLPPAALFLLLLFQTSLSVARRGPLLAGVETCSRRSRLCGVKRSFKAFLFCFGLVFFFFLEVQTIDLTNLCIVPTVLLKICQLWLLKLMHKYTSSNCFVLFCFFKIVAIISFCSPCCESKEKELAGFKPDRCNSWVQKCCLVALDYYSAHCKHVTCWGVLLLLTEIRLQDQWFPWGGAGCLGWNQAHAMSYSDMCQAPLILTVGSSDLSDCNLA